MRDKAPAGFRWLKPNEHRKAGDVYPNDGGPIPSITIGWPINHDTILRPTKAISKPQAKLLRLLRHHRNKWGRIYLQLNPGEVRTGKALARRNLVEIDTDGTGARAYAD